MIELIKDIIPYISGLWTLPWILIGFIITITLSKFIAEERLTKIMKKIGLILLYFFVPVLLFRIFLNQNFEQQQLEFTLVTSIVLFFMYLLAYLFARYTAKKRQYTSKNRRQFIKTVLTNQGRSSAFIGGALLASPWFVEAAIFIALVGIVLFAIIPYILSVMHKHESRNTDEPVHALPWYLKLYPWYLISFVIAAILLHNTTGFTFSDLGDLGVVLKFYTALTIPAALYYVGSGIHPHDFKLSEMKKLFTLHYTSKQKDHWPWTRNIFFLTVILTPVLTTISFGLLLIMELIPNAWFTVIVINSFLPITSTNMFLVPYGIDKKVTALSVTWTTVVCVPIIVCLIYIFTLYLP